MNKQTKNVNKYIYLIVFALFLQFGATAQVLNISSYGGNSNDQGYLVKSDKGGGSVIAGTFSNVATFGDTTLTSQGGSDVFVMHRNEIGEILWVKSIGTISEDVPRKLYVNYDGVVFVLVNSTIYRFDSIGDAIKTPIDRYPSISDFYLNDGGTYYIAYSTNSSHEYDWFYGGGIGWGTKTFRGQKIVIEAYDALFDNLSFKYETDGLNQVEQISKLFIGNFGSIYYTALVTGDYIDGSSLKKRDSNYNNKVLRKATPKNEIIWEHSTNELFQGYLTDRDQNVYFHDGSKIYKYNADHALIFTRNFLKNSIKDIAISGDKLYVTGDFISSQVSFGNDTTIYKNHKSEVYLVKLDIANNFYGVIQFGSSQKVNVSEISYVAGKNISLTGSYEGTFFDVEDSENVFTSSGGRDAFVTLLDDRFGSIKKEDSSLFEDPTIIHTKRFGGNQDDMISCVEYDNRGNVIVAGTFANEMKIGNAHLKSKGNADGFIAKLDTLGNVIWAKSFGDSSHETILSIHQTSSNETYVATNLMVYKFDASGNEIPVPTFPQNTRNNYLISFHLDKNDNYYFAYTTNVTHIYNRRYYPEQGGWTEERFGGEKIIIKKFDRLDNEIGSYETDGYYDYEMVLDMFTDQSNNLIFSYRQTGYKLEGSIVRKFSYDPLKGNLKKLDSSMNEVWDFTINPHASGFISDSQDNLYYSIDNNIYKYNKNYGLMWSKKFAFSGFGNPILNIYKEELYVLSNITQNNIDIGNDVSIVKVRGERITLMKFDLDGNALAIGAIGSDLSQWGNDFTFDDVGNLYIGGYFTNEYALNFSKIISYGGYDALLIKQTNDFKGTEKTPDYAGGRPTSFPISNKVIAAEYFFGKDPGGGNGFPLVLAEADSAEWKFDLPTTGLQPGFHQVTLRVKDDLNKWSIFESRYLYVLDTSKVIPTKWEPAKQIVAFEYFFGEDPGIGKGTQLQIAASDSAEWELKIPTTGLQPGFQQLTIRVKDDQSNWSIFEQRNFYMLEPAEPADPKSKIKTVEYYLASDQGFPPTAFDVISTGDILDIQYTIDLAGKPFGKDSLFVRVLDEKGMPSSYQYAPFEISATQPDLLFSNINITTPLLNASELVQVNYKVVNAGTKDVTDSYKLNIYISTDEQLDASDPILYSTTKTTDVLKQSNIDLNASFTIPDTVATGNRYLLFQVDVDKAILEANEANNVLPHMVSINGVVNQLSDLLTDKEALKVYPNPARDFMIVAHLKDLKNIQITNIQGRLIKTFSPNKNGIYDVSTFNTGTYILIGNFINETSSVRKLVIRK